MSAVNRAKFPLCFEGTGRVFLGALSASLCQHILSPCNSTNFATCSALAPDALGTTVASPVMDWYWVCGSRVYVYLPENWGRRCTFTLFNSSLILISHNPLGNKHIARRNRRSADDDFPPPEHQLRSKAAKFWDCLFPQYGISQVWNQLEMTHYRLATFTNATRAAIRGIRDELTALRLTAMQNRLALDLLLAKEGGVCAMVVCRPGLHENPRRGPLAQVPENEPEHEEEHFGVLMEYIGEEQQGHVEGHVGEALNGFDFMEEQRQEEENVGEAMIDFDMREDHRHEEEHLGVLIEYFGEEEQRHIEEHVGEAVFGFDMRDEQEDEEEHLGVLIEFFGEEEQQHEEEHVGVVIEDFGEEEQVPEEENADEAMIGFDLREEQEHEEEHFGLLIEDFMEEEQALDERIVLENAENDGGNGNPDYRNEHRSIFMELPHSSSEAGKSFVMGHHQESLGNLKDLPQEAMQRTQQNLTDEEPGSSSSCSRQDRNPGIPEQYNASTMSCPDASTPPQNDPNQNGPVSENHLEVSNNVEAHSSIDAGPSEGHSSSSPETQSNSRKRKRKSNFPSSSCNSPETDDSPSKRRRSDSDGDSD
ncbi:hypothetical protein SRHO_G00079110 [Serrasalmus rhombeus]